MERRHDPPGEELGPEVVAGATEERLAPTIPMRRLGTPEEVAKTIYFLCTEQSSYVTGSALAVDGGRTFH